MRRQPSLSARAIPARVKLSAPPAVCRNLGVGAYRTNGGKPFVLDVVKKAETAVTAKLVDNQFNGPPTPLSGLILSPMSS